MIAKMNDTPDTPLGIRLVLEARPSGDIHVIGDFTTIEAVDRAAAAMDGRTLRDHTDSTMVYRVTDDNDWIVLAPEGRVARRITATITDWLLYGPSQIPTRFHTHADAQTALEALPVAVRDQASIAPDI